MFSSHSNRRKETATRLESLRAEYRMAFRNWISAHKDLHASPDAQNRIAAAAVAYGEARDLLTAEMLGPQRKIAAR